jgi:hypothetical protein
MKASNEIALEMHLDMLWSFPTMEDSIIWAFNGSNDHWSENQQFITDNG